LSFKNIPEKLLVPFESVTRFSDPSVEFDLKFEPEEEIAETSANDEGSPGRFGTPKLVAEPESAEVLEESDAATREDNEDASVEPAVEANVVSIDAFRKKT
jgi:hypothetical protein